MPAARVRPQVTDEGDRVVIDIPAGVTYAALGLRVEADNDTVVAEVIMRLADRFAAVVHAHDGPGTVHIVHGAEAVAAFDIASRQTAAHLGLERDEHTIEPDREMLADHLRTRAAQRLDVAERMLPWGRLTDSEQTQWLGHADAAIEFVVEMI